MELQGLESSSATEAAIMPFAHGQCEHCPEFTVVKGSTGFFDYKSLESPDVHGIL